MQNSFLMLPQRESGATWSLVVDSYCWFTEHEKEISNKIKSSFLTLRKKKVEPPTKVLFVYQADTTDWNHELLDAGRIFFFI